MVQRGEQEEPHAGPNRELRPGTANPARKRIWITGDMAKPRERLRSRTESHGARERTVLSERRTAQHNYVRLDLHELFVAETVLGHIADREILGDEITALDNLARDLLRLRQSQIQRYTLARGVDRVEHAAPVESNHAIGAGQKSH